MSISGASIPATIDDVDAGWLSEATGMAVESLTHELIGVGIGVSSAVYRLSLTGDGVPPTMVLKLAALDEAAVFTASVLRMYEREVKFFDSVGPRSPIRVPKGYGGAMGEDGATYYLLMEDMGGNRSVDQILGMEIVDAERAVEELAAWHAEFWGQAETFVENGSAVSLADPIYPAVLPTVFGEGLEKLQAGMELPALLRDAAALWPTVFEQLLARLSSSPTTLCHGDYRADNIFFADDGSVVLLDFQLIGLGRAAFDFAYFVTQSLVADVAAAHEKELFDRYLAALLAAGVPEADTTDLWDDYKAAALFCLVYPVAASRGMDLDDPRQFDLLDNMNQRCARAIEEHGLLDLRI